MATKSKLTLGTLKSAVNKIYTQKKVTVEIDSKQYSFLVDEHADPIKVDAMAKELMEKSIYMKEHNYELSDTNYFQFLILKHMTDIDVCNTASDFSIQIQILTYFLKLKILDKVISVVNINEINELMPQSINNAIQSFASDEMKKQIENNPSLLTNILGDKNKDIITLLEKAKEIKDLESKVKDGDLVESGTEGLEN